MDRRPAAEAVEGLLGLLAVGAALAFAVVLDRLAPGALESAGLGWVVPSAAAAITIAGAIATLACVANGVRDGSLAALLLAGASAALASGGLGLATTGSGLVPAVGAAATFSLAAAVADRLTTLVHGRTPRLAAASACVTVAGLTAVAGIAPAVSDLLMPAWPGVLVGAAVAAAAATGIARRRELSVASGAIVVSAVAVFLADGSDVTLLFGLVALLCSAALTAHGRLESGATPTSGADPGVLPPLAEHIGDAVLRFDGRLQLRSWNPAAARLLVLDDAAAGSRLEDLFGVSLDQLAANGTERRSISAAGGMEVAFHRDPDGVTAVVRSAAAADQEERLGRELRGTVEELLQARRTVELQRAELERAASIDSLTGVASRAMILERLAVEVAEARRYHHPVAVVLLDVDRFAEVNAAHGTAGGDAVLREVALRMRLRVRRADSLGRADGDAFLAVLPHGDDVAATTFAEALRRRVAGRPIVVGGSELTITLSAGVAVMRPGEDIDGDALLDRAERALARTREAGADGVAVEPPHGLVRLDDRRGAGAPDNTAPERTTQDSGA